MQWQVREDNLVDLDTEYKDCTVTAEVDLAQSEDYSYYVTISYSTVQVFLSGTAPYRGGCLSEIEGVIHKTIEFVKEIQ